MGGDSPASPSRASDPLSKRDGVVSLAAMSTKAWTAEKLRSAGNFLLRYVDALVAIASAVVVIYLVTTGNLKDETLAVATGALIVAVALAIVRDRWERQEDIDKLGRAISQERKAAVGAIEEAITVGRDAAVAGFQRIARDYDAKNAWRILEETMSWDLIAHDGSQATAIARKKLLFTQDEVLCVYEYQFPSDSHGKVTKHLCYGGEQEPLELIPIVYDSFPGREGRRYRLISLERVWRRGEIMRYRSERHLKDHFLKQTEHVSKEISSPTERITLSVIWPSTRPPRTLWLERTDRRETIDTKGLAVIDGRSTFTKTVPDAVVGERICLFWTW